MNTEQIKAYIASFSENVINYIKTSGKAVYDENQLYDLTCSSESYNNQNVKYIRLYYQVILPRSHAINSKDSNLYDHQFQFKKKKKRITSVKLKDSTQYDFSLIVIKLFNDQLLTLFCIEKYLKDILNMYKIYFNNLVQIYFRLKCATEGDILKTYSYVWKDIVNENEIIYPVNDTIFLKILLVKVYKDTKNNYDSLNTCDSPTSYQNSERVLSTINTRTIPIIESFNSFSNSSFKESSFNDYFKSSCICDDKPLSSRSNISQSLLKLNNGALNELSESLNQSHESIDQSNEITDQYDDVMSMEQIDKWALNPDGSIKDIRTLLHTLNEVLWQQVKWENKKMSELICMTRQQLKKEYKSALMICHPDKHHTSPLNIQSRAHKIFKVLYEAFKDFLK